MKISVADAKNKLSELIKVLDGGEAATICRCGMPVVDIVRMRTAAQGKPKFGILRGRMGVSDRIGGIRCLRIKWKHSLGTANSWAEDVRMVNGVKE